MHATQTVTVRRIQEKMLGILVYFQQFCEENHLPFVLCGGSCLGAVRHKGFIPWDDDVDVFMLREDYEKLEALWALKADTARFACVRSNETVNIHHNVTEIKDNHTTFINRHSMHCDIHHGVMIDVIPLDGVPDARGRQLMQKLHSMLFCCFNFQRIPEHKGKLTYYATKLALGVVRSQKLRYRLWKHAERRLSRYGTADSAFVSSLVEGGAIMHQRYPVSWFREPAYLEFEGYRMPVPGDWDAYLKMLYGDYMQLPPEDERVARHTAAFIDLDHPYTQYKGIQYCVEK